MVNGGAREEEERESKEKRGPRNREQKECMVKLAGFCRYERGKGNL